MDQEYVHIIEEAQRLIAGMDRIKASLVAALRKSRDEMRALTDPSSISPPPKARRGGAGRRPSGANAPPATNGQNAGNSTVTPGVPPS